MAKMSDCPACNFEFYDLGDCGYCPRCGAQIRQPAKPNNFQSDHLAPRAGWVDVKICANETCEHNGLPSRDNRFPLYYTEREYKYCPWCKSALRKRQEYIAYRGGNARKEER
jgi:hypothetical protein